MHWEEKHSSAYHWRCVTDTTGCNSVVEHKPALWYNYPDYISTKYTGLLILQRVMLTLHAQEYQLLQHTLYVLLISDLGIRRGQQSNLNNCGEHYTEERHANAYRWCCNSVLSRPRNPNEYALHRGRNTSTHVVCAALTVNIAPAFQFLQ